MSYETYPLTSLSLRFCYRLGVEITSVCWHIFAVVLCFFVGVGIRMKATGITIMTGGWYMIQGCYGCGVTVDTHFRIGITENGASNVDGARGVWV